MNKHPQYINKVYSNISQELIEITCDKLRLILHDYTASLEMRKTWETPGMLFITLLITILTVDFKNAFGIDKNVWQAVFLMSTVLSFLWFIRAFILSLVKPKVSVEDVINKIKDTK